jgi:proline iminopeptidase
MLENKRMKVTRRNRKFLILGAIFIALLFAGSSATAGEKEKKLKVEEGMKAINGTELYYKTIGEGTPIVILHGGPGLDHSYFLPQMAQLARHYKLIFFDQRASGRSSNLVDTSAITMTNFVEDVEGIRKAFKLKKMNLFGHSWGGLVAMFYAVKYPDNLNSLMLVNSTPASAGWRNASFVLMARRASPEDSIAQARLVQTEGFRKRSPKAMSDFFRILFRSSFYNRTYADSLTLSLDTSFTTKSRLMQYLNKDTTLLNYDVFRKLSVVHCPTLIMSSRYDMVAPEANERLQQSIPGSTHVVLDSCGHFPFVEAPRKFFSTVEGFLKKAAR